MEEQLQVEQVNNQDTKTSSYNVKPRLLARILGALVDIFLLFLVTFAGFQLEMATPISNDYHHLQDELIAIVDDTKLETEFGYNISSKDRKYGKKILDIVFYRGNFGQYNKRNGFSGWKHQVEASFIKISHFIKFVPLIPDYSFRWVWHEFKTKVI